MQQIRTFGTKPAFKLTGTSAPSLSGSLKDAQWLTTTGCRTLYCTQHTYFSVTRLPKLWALPGP